jgi:hypothetical protein
MNMNMDIETWETDERMQKVLISVLKVAGQERTVLTTYRELSRNAGWLRVDLLTATLKKLRREGIIALKTTIGRGMQVTVLRKLRIVDRQPTATAQR